MVLIISTKIHSQEVCSKSDVWKLLVIVWLNRKLWRYVYDYTLPLLDVESHILQLKKGCHWVDFEVARLWQERTKEGRK